MYVPPHAREERADVLARAVNEIGFGTLVTIANDRPMLTHLPMVFVPNDAHGTTLGHVSRANDQWKVAADAQAVAAFVGPSFYVSPSAYASKQLTGKVVPTWNYIAVEACGSITFFDDPQRLHTLVAQLTNHHEAARAEPWAIGDAPDDFIAGQIRGIVGFELIVDEMIGAWKLSRNRTDADRAGVAALMERSENPSVAELAATVRNGAERGRDS
jgi:transcriptional regulator